MAVYGERQFQHCPDLESMSQRQPLLLSFVPFQRYFINIFVHTGRDAFSHVYLLMFIYVHTILKQKYLSTSHLFGGEGQGLPMYAAQAGFELPM
jgi:hypothetical protein